MQGKEKGNMGVPAAELVKHRDAIAKLAASADAKDFMQMLNRKGGVQQAAQAAAGGDAGALLSMVEGLMQTEEGARLVERISQQARDAGLK